MVAYRKHKSYFEIVKIRSYLLNGPVTYARLMFTYEDTMNKSVIIPCSGGGITVRLSYCCCVVSYDCQGQVWSIDSYYNIWCRRDC